MNFTLISLTISLKNQAMMHPTEFPITSSILISVTTNLKNSAVTRLISMVLLIFIKKLVLRMPLWVGLMKIWSNFTPWHDWRIFETHWHSSLLCEKQA